MGITALDLSEMIDYVSKLDKDEPKTVWKLGVLDTRIRKQLEDVGLEYEVDPNQPGSGKAKTSLNLCKSELDFVAFGLKGFENFRKADGKQVYFKTDQRGVNGKVYYVVAEEILKIIPSNIITELATKIRDLNTVSEEEIKN